MRMRLAALSVMVVLAIACGTSEIPDETEVTITGSLLLPDGKPAAGVAVGLIEEPSGIDAIAELTVAVTSLGMLCLTRQVSLCRGAKRTTTGDDGGYRFTMKGKEAKTIFGNPARFVVSSELDSGPSLQIRFDIADATVAVPATTFWRPSGLAVTPGPQWVEYSWPAFHIKPRPTGYRIEVAEGRNLVWAQQSGTSGRLDTRALSDVDGQFRAIATVEHDSFVSEHYSQPIPVSGRAGAPPSRDATCTVAGHDGPTPVTPCPFTDGSYAGPFPRQSCAGSPAPTPGACPANTSITIDLGGARPIGAVFLHGLGLSSSPEIWTSDDGLKWTRRARHERAEYAALTLASPVVARYVRVQSSQASDTIWSLHEVTIWP